MLVLGAYLLLRGEKSGLLFGTFTKHRAGNVFLDNTKKVEAGTFLTRFRADLSEAGVDAAEWIGTHSFKRGGVQLLRDLGIDDCEIKERGRWSTMAAYWAYVQASNRLEKRSNYSSTVAALVDVTMRGGFEPTSDAETALEAVASRSEDGGRQRVGGRPE